jgi:hypothetical protein
MTYNNHFSIYPIVHGVVYKPSNLKAIKPIEISLIPLIKIFSTDLLFCLADLIQWGFSGCVSVVCLRS